MKVLEDFEFRVQTVRDHLTDGNTVHWNEQLLSSQPVQALIAGASAAMAKNGLHILDVANILSTDMVAELSPATQRVILWALAARGLGRDLSLMRPLVCVAHLAHNGRLDERCIDVPGRFNTLVMHAQNTPTGQYPSIVLRVYSADEVDGHLQIGGSLLRAEKQVLVTPCMRENSAYADTELYQSLRDGRGRHRLDVANTPLFTAATHMLIALRAAAAYRRASSALQNAAERRGTVVDSLEPQLESDDPLYGYKLIRQVARAYFVERTGLQWQRFARVHGPDDYVPDVPRLQCRGALGPCVPYGATDTGTVVEDLTPVVDAASRHMYQGRIVQTMSRDTAGGWTVQTADSIEPLQLTEEQLSAGHSRTMIPQICTVADAPVYRGYSRTPTVDDLQFRTSDGVPVDLGWTWSRDG